jgi:uncharacterized membrane protein YphA (DoxX/SURF4 family)
MTQVQTSHDRHTAPATAYRPGSGSGTERRASGRANVALWVLQALVAAAFLMASVTKLTAYPEVVRTFDQIGFGHWFMYLIGGLELAGAIAVLVPRLCGLAGLALTGLLIGAVVTELLVADAAHAATPAGYLIPVAIVAWARRDRTARLVTRKAGG